MSYYIRINQIKVDINEENNLKNTNNYVYYVKENAKKTVKETNNVLLDKVSDKLKVKKAVLEQYLEEFKILKKSLDARKKEEIHYSYSVELKVSDEFKINHKVLNNNIMLTRKQKYNFPIEGNEKLKHRPVVVGSGPAGLFCSYFLAIKGFKPILIERGEPVEERTKTVEGFFKGEKLNTESNVQFGEGGAGTFSDGKLNTTVKDPTGRNGLVLETFVKFGADESITYINKPHIGTDVLCGIVKNMREEIIRLGGTVMFSTKFEDFILNDNKLSAIKVLDLKSGETKEIPTEVLVLAIGHSARDTFYNLYNKNIHMEAKPFAVGVRVEHKQDTINKNMYGEKYKNVLPTADYKVTYTCENGRGVYSFCMCPGGYVVNASSEEGRLAVNGMSYSARDGENANSAIIVAVRTEDFADEIKISPLFGVEFQRKLEEKAFRACGGKIPVQRFGDFKEGKVTEEFGCITPNTKGTVGFADINEILPDFICESLKEGMEAFGHMIKGFDNEDTLMLAVESRTSSPVKIPRDENFVCNIPGIYPCGEGAGYAGGITSAAIDGIRIFEAIFAKYKGNLT